jgi:hypothetical protein
MSNQPPTAVQIGMTLDTPIAMGIPTSRVEILIRVIDEPHFPTPNEPEVSRIPGVGEWITITDRLRKLSNLTVTPVQWPLPPKP